MKIIACVLISACVGLNFLSGAEAAPRKMPLLQQANAHLQMVSIRHNQLKALILVRRTTK